MSNQFDQNLFRNLLFNELHFESIQKKNMLGRVFIEVFTGEFLFLIEAFPYKTLIIWFKYLDGIY